MSIEQALQFTLKAEGTFTVDDGGPTMYGVTQSVYDAYRASKHRSTQSVELISQEELKDIEIDNYWNPAGCGYLPDNLAICHFDWAYNHGVSGAIYDLQQVLRIPADGILGPVTIKSFLNTTNSMVVPYLQKRKSVYHSLVKENSEKYERYLVGWLDRVNQLQDYIERLIVGKNIK